ncbi:hypothetical protein CsSME_00041076 [Camellia sinensis var. sinensis]
MANPTEWNNRAIGIYLIIYRKEASMKLQSSSGMRLISPSILHLVQHLMFLMVFYMNGG